METNPPPAQEEAHSLRGDGRVSTRGRPRIYSERKAISLRLPESVHQRMTILCDELEIPFNTYITDLIKADLKKRGG
ncbi:MAG: toxin-antitoxin system HicB family antitoxin [Lautropia sp.]|jgi:predicted HicB family RNase H-like nuclease|nr:MAG: toxin-antitoxin system HicB family antitoxin [Lautropia sp.]